MKYISSGQFGHWSVDKNNYVYFRFGVSIRRPQGTKWIRVPGRLHQIESGPDGAAWGVNLITGVFARLGITRANPIGTKWRHFRKKKLASISVGLGVLYGVDKYGKPFKAETSILVGKSGIPKRPAG